MWIIRGVIIEACSQQDWESLKISAVLKSSLVPLLKRATFPFIRTIGSFCVKFFCRFFKRAANLLFIRATNTCWVRFSHRNCQETWKVWFWFMAFETYITLIGLFVGAMTVTRKLLVLWECKNSPLPRLNIQLSYVLDVYMSHPNVAFIGPTSA